MPSPSVNRYLKRGMHRVQGWLHSTSAHLISELSELQFHLGVNGSIAEVGVHHGKLFILMHLLAAQNSGLPDTVIDVFDQQALNLDRSGKGDYQVFRRNVERWGGNWGKLNIITKSSLEVQPQEIEIHSGPLRMFSIDGGHTAQCVVNDLALAQATLHPLGIVILDDVYNEYWPDVAVGTIEFLRSHESRLKYFAISPGKVFLCQQEAAEQLRTELKARINPGLYEKSVDVLGAQVDVYGVRQAMPGIMRKVKSVLLRSPQGRRLRELLRARRKV